MPPVTVGIDYLPAVQHPPGIGRYGRELVRALVRLEDAPPLALFEVGGGGREMDGAPLGLEGLAAGRVRRLRGRWPRRAVRLAGRLGLGADRLLGGVRLFHRLLPDHPPVSRARETLPVAELPPAGSVADAQLGAVLRRMAGVFVFSDAYRTEVLARHGLDPARVHRVHVGCEHWVRDLGPRTQRVEPARPPRVLVLGAVRAARHPLAALEGVEALHAGGREVELLVVGRPGDAAPAFRERLARSRAPVRWIEEPVEADMPLLVASSAVLLHLADEEGTPVTPLEACAMGLAVAADPVPSFREALGDEATWLADRSPAAVAEALETALASDGEEVRARRRDLARPYTWTRAARETLDAWRPLLA